ncbi:hypothetical protein NT6N_20520 [Oceaniferula spumae]|uniref:Uncharacterized protein n=1 Tax=Oceaniferula spumae TaxID=2979115 RepID=A0AAT9FLL9_9BACT
MLVMGGSLYTAEIVQVEPRGVEAFASTHVRDALQLGGKKPIPSSWKRLEVKANRVALSLAATAQDHAEADQAE